MSRFGVVEPIVMRLYGRLSGPEGRLSTRVCS